MELSSLTSVTSSSTRGADTKGNASKDTASAPFADVMQRAAVTEKPQQPGSAGGDSTSRAANSSTSQQATSAPAAQGPDAELANSEQAATDTQQILQALEQGDMSGLHAVLASLSGKTQTDKADGTALSDAQAIGDSAESLDAEDLAAIIAALPLTVNPQPAPTGAANGTAALSAGQSALQQRILTTADGARSTSAMLSSDLSDDSDQPGSSVRGKGAFELPGSGGLLSSIEVNRNGNPTSPSATVAGQALPMGDSSAAALTGALADAASASSAERGALDSDALSNPRLDAGSLTGLTSSLSSAAGLSSTTTATAANGAIATSVQSPQWPASLGQQVLQMHQRGDQQMSLRLHPQELGPLSVSLTVQDQQAQLQILSAHAPVRAAVEAAIPQLRQALADSGIALGEAMVGDQGQFQQGQSPNGDQPRRGPSASGPLLAASGVDTSDDAMLRQVVMTSNGNINLYA